MKWFWFAVIVLALLAIPVLSGHWWRAPETVQTGPLTVRKQEKAGLLIKAWVATNRVKAGDAVPFWILFGFLDSDGIVERHLRDKEVPT